jgi:hypothetical protein
MNTTIKHRFDDDDSHFDNRMGQETADLMNRLEKQFRRLQTKALEIGVQSIVIIHANDPLNGYSFRRANRKGDHYANLGALKVVTKNLEDYLASDSD